VAGSFTYTVPLGAGALARPLRLLDASQLRLPWLLMLGAPAFVLGLAWPRRRLGRRARCACLALYPVFVILILVT